MTLAESIRKVKTMGNVPVIAEIKRVIPKLADKRLRDNRSAASLAGKYSEGGAAGISLVAEKQYFGGQPEIDIPAVLNSTTLPLLIKDFIFEKKQIDDYARLFSRLGIESLLERVTLLLMSHWLGDNLKIMLNHVHACGMMALVETRNYIDCRLLINLTNKPELIGINNKNIDELERDKDSIKLTREEIARYRKIAAKSILISESAHRTAVDVRRSIKAGADAVLVGTAFLVSDNITETVHRFVHSNTG